MSICNAPRVLELTRVTHKNIAAEPHAHRMNAIMANMATLERPIKFFAAPIMIEEECGLDTNEKYLTDMIEAMFLANYDDSASLIAAFAANMREGAEIPRIRKYYPSVILATLRVCNSDVAVATDGTKLPWREGAQIIGQLFCDWIDSSRPTDKKPSEWIAGQISAQLHTYLDGSEVSKALLSAVGQKPVYVEKPLHGVIGNLTHRLFGVLSFEKQFAQLVVAFDV